MAHDLQVVSGFTLALIALVAGLELNVRRMRVGTMLVLTLALWAAWPIIPFGGIASGPARLAAAFVTAVLVASFSPTVTIAVIAESRSRGPLTGLVMAIVVMADLLLILVFALGLQFARWTMTSAPTEIGVGVQLSWEIFGSLAFGGIVGALFATYSRVVRREITLALLGVCALLAVVAPLLRFELILAALAGLVVENVAPPEGDEMRTAIERGALPVLVAFFAAAGASLQLDVLAVVGAFALLLAALRLALIWGIADVAVRRASPADTPARFVWMGLISQAGVTLGLATIVASEFPGWGTEVRTLIIALTGLHVLIGPILLKAALQRAGEIPPSEVRHTARVP